MESPDILLEEEKGKSLYKKDSQEGNTCENPVGDCVTPRVENLVKGEVYGILRKSICKGTMEY